MPLRCIRSRAEIPFVTVAHGGFGAPALGTAFAKALAFGAAFATAFTTVSLAVESEPLKC